MREIKVGDRRRFSSARALLLVTAMLLALALFAAGCGASGSNDASVMESGSSMNFTSADMPAESVNIAATSRGEAGAASQPASVSDPYGGDADSAFPAAPLSEPAGSVMDALDRKLIYEATVSMEVADYGDAQTELFNLITMSRGYVLNFSDSESRYELGGNFVIKVPSGGFQSFLTELERLKKGDAFWRSVQGRDVTEEYVDLTARLKAKQVVEERLLGFMEKASDTKSLVEFSNQLASVQEEIERIKGRMRYLDQNVAYSTIELRMYERLETKELPKDERNAIWRAGQAMKSSAEGIVAFFEGLLIVLAGALPILVVLAVLVVPVWLLVRKAREKWNVPGATRSNTQTSSYSTVVLPDEKPAADGKRTDEKRADDKPVDEKRTDE